VTRRRAITGHLETMGEIRGIMAAMKNMALAEHRKVGRRLEAQGRALRGIEAAAGDFLAFYPQPAPPPEALAPVWLVVGSERGFCGDFNEVLAREVLARAEGEPGPAPVLLAVGYKLGLRLDGRPGVARLLDGAGVADEVGGALAGVVAALRELEAERGPLAVTALHHDPDAGYPPLIHLAPEDLFARLVDQYLLAALTEVFLSSLLAENQQRMRHLEGALRRLDEHRRELALKANALRQEEITEEIEMILLNVEAGA